MVSSSGFEDDDYFYVPSLGKTKNSAVKQVCGRKIVGHWTKGPQGTATY